MVSFKSFLLCIFVGFFWLHIPEAVAKDCPSAEKSFKEYKSELQKCMNERGYDLNDNDLKKLTNKKVSLKFYTETNEEISKDDEALKNNSAKSSDIVFENKTYSDISAITNKFSNNIYAIHKSLQKEISLFKTNKVALPIDEATLTENLFAGFEQTISPIKEELSDGAEENLNDINAEEAVSSSGNNAFLIGGVVAVGALARGGKGRMTAGDVQWMRTGSGIIHSEMPAMKEGKLHGFQLWINMPAKLKMSKPEYIYIDADKMSVHKDKDKQVKVIAGKFENAEGPVKGHNVEPVYFDVELNKDKEFNFELPQTHNSFIYLINGEIKIGDKDHEEVSNSTLILLTKGNKLKIKAKSNAKFLVISGKPINEEIARGGPFVMNTKSEILQAVKDYHNGTFVK